MPLKIPPAIATPLIKGGRGDLNTIYSIQEVCCVSPELLPFSFWENWLGDVEPRTSHRVGNLVELQSRDAFSTSFPRWGRMVIARNGSHGS